VKKWPTRMVKRPPIRFLFFGILITLLVGAAFPIANIIQSARAASGQNAIQIENSQLGDPTWDDFASSLTPDLLSGYGSKISVNHGDSIDFFVTTTYPSLSIDIYRTGWYNGAGARKMTSLGTFTGVHQAIPNPDPVTGLIACNWAKTTTFTIPSNWVSGVYLARLNGSGGDKSFIFFVVRNDGGNEDLLMQTSVTTYQAYNEWGGLSLYSNSLSNKSLYSYPHATKVSFDRPFNPGDSNGAGHYLFYEYKMVYWLESQGYNVAYTTNVDTDGNTSTLTNHKGFLSVGHDEYWSLGMRNTIEQAINAGVNVAFFSANTMYWQIRFEPNAAGSPKRVEVGYKDFAMSTSPPGPDPQWNVNNAILTGYWREAPVNRPENGTIGVMYEDQVNQDFAFVVQDASNWIFAGTGFVNGTSIPGIIGYEYDKVYNNGATPAGLQVVGHSPVTGGTVGHSFADTTLYTAPSGARVFASGTIQWSWGLAPVDGNPYTNAGIQKVTTNILNSFINGQGPSVGLAPNSLAFGNQNMGTSSAAQTVTVSNSGTAALNITSITITGTNASDFAQTNNCPATLAANTSCTISVIFTPGATGTRTASVTLTDNAPSSPQTIALSGTGVAPAPAVTLNPTSLTFSSQNVGTTSAAQTFTLTNSGAASLTISSIALTGTNAGDFAQTNNCPASLAASASCTVSVTFKPTATGTRTAAVTLTDNAANSPQMLALSGTGITSAPAVTLNPTSLTFSSQNVGTTSAAQTVTLTNSGTASLTISSIALTGTNAGDFAQTNNCPASLAASTSCTINATFTPTATGTRTAAVTLTDNAANSPQTVALSGTGVAPAPAVTLNPTSLTFSSQNVGTTSAAQTATLTNSGTATLTISSIALTGTNASDFAQTNNCPASLAANASCTVSVTFTPTATGARTAAVTLTDNAANSPQTVALNGTGGSANPAVTLNPTSLSFGNQNIGSTSSAQTVTLTNSGTASLTITSVALNGTNPGDFAQTNNCPASLAANASCTVSVTFKPTISGSRTATLTFLDNAANSPQTVALSGTGTTSSIYFSDGFETGNLSKWTLPSSDSTGTRTVQSTTVNTGGNALQFNNANGQYAYVYTALSAPQTQTFTRFYFRLDSTFTGSTELAMARNANGSNIWEIDYDASRKGLDVYIWNSSNGILTISSASNVVSANTWYSIEVQDNEATSGQAQAWLNGTSIGTVTGNLSSANPYANLMLFDSSVGKMYVDDVQVSSTYNGAAVPSPNVTLSPTTLTFTNQTVGTTSAAKPVTLTNTGTATLTISSITFTDEDPSDFAQTNNCPASLVANASCTINVTFTPIAAGTRNAKLTLTDNAANSPQSVSLSGAGVSTGPAVTLNPTALSFGNQNLNTTSAAQTVTVTDSGASSLTISSIALSGTNAGDFAQTNNCPVTLAANASCTVSITFKPTATGAKTASLTITDNAPNSPQSVALSGTGVNSSVYFSDGFESGNLNLWTLPSSDSTGTRTVQSTVVHTGTRALALTNTSGQYSYVYTALSSAQSQTFTKFSFYYSSNVTGGTQLAIARNSSGNNVWEVDYNASAHSLDIYFWNGANTIFSISTPANALTANTWYNVEIQDTQASAGQAQVWLNGTSVGTISGDLSMANPYARLMFYDDTPGTIYVDDVLVSNAY
jgi:Abnormal spindle-like microcephaly-assoc'd, ASPM-SPD-2-Hydin